MGKQQSVHVCVCLCVRVFMCACVCVRVCVCLCVVEVECNAIWKSALIRRLNQIYHRQHAATYCQTLQHTATLYSTLQDTAKEGLVYNKNLKFEEPFIKNTSAYYQKKKKLRLEPLSSEQVTSLRKELYTATHCQTLPDTARHCKTLQYTATGTSRAIDIPRSHVSKESAISVIEEFNMSHVSVWTYVSSLCQWQESVFAFVMTDTAHTRQTVENESCLS